ncbi:MAG: hypothetical protein ACFE89_10295 [Candidatus Hodarchaeota archaeon]
MSNSRLTSVVLLVSLLFPMFITPTIYLPSLTVNIASTATETGPTFSMEPMAITIPPDMIRVAIYNEPNITRPAYDTTGISNLANSSSQIAAILQSAGYQTTLLDTQDILNHQLMTAHFDVFVIPDNLPRENIINHVFEFWLGGGALLGFDSFAVYSCYMGIMPPESAGSDGYSVYWLYNGDSANVSARHPVSRHYAINDTYTLPPYGYAAWDWTALMGTSIAGQLTKVAHDGLVENEATVLAFDPTTRGGRVVHIWWDGSTASLPAIHPMVEDAIMWLCPRPMGRVVYDMSHRPRLAIDPWDTLTMYPNYFPDMRDYLVSRGFTFDKLYPAPSGNNFTTARLDPYDLLIVNVPDYNYTAGDRTAVEAWVNAGGSLLALTDWPDPIWFVKPDEQQNMLLAPFGIAVNLSSTVGVTGAATFTTFTMHPTTEGCTSLYYNYFGYLNLTGSAYPIWWDGPNIVAAGSEYGLGRVIVTSDINWFQTPAGNFGQANNQQYILNIANWLSAATARVLIYTDEIYSPNYYKTAVALALNDLGIDFYLTGAFASPWYDYFNLSLYRYTWDLVIVDNANQFNLFNYYDDLVNYLDTGGSMIFTSFDADVGAGHPLFNRLGVTHASSVGGEPLVHIWDSAHHVFTMPHLFTNANFTSTIGYIDDGDKFTTFANATAIAGATPTSVAGEAFIVVRNDGKTLLNGYIIDNFQTDADDSTYEDRLELWMNEIAFIMAPRCVFTPNVPPSHIQGFPLTFSVDIINNGLTPAIGGELTVTIPAALGILSESATQPFVLDPGASTTITWHSTATGVGNHTITFDGTYHGVPATTYDSGTITRYLNVTPGLPFALPWWWWIAAIAVIVIVVIIILVLCLRRRSGSK